VQDPHHGGREHYITLSNFINAIKQIARKAQDVPQVSLDQYLRRSAQVVSRTGKAGKAALVTLPA